jgi:hypothetical protein
LIAAKIIKNGIAVVSFVVVVMGIWSDQLTGFLFILSYEAGFYKSTLLKAHPPISLYNIFR